jgi:hypothetical protein
MVGWGVIVRDGNVVGGAVVICGGWEGTAPGDNVIGVASVGTDIGATDGGTYTVGWGVIVRDGDVVGGTVIGIGVASVGAGVGLTDGGTYTVGWGVIVHDGDVVGGTVVTCGVLEGTAPVGNVLGVVPVGTGVGATDVGTYMVVWGVMVGAGDAVGGTVS